ncbi:MAG TPA: efflux RND transporter permease subunit, partial [Candidatus Kapabacteria bacterium]|nr:efflux RND transporter permease subunit [Candidatus Kapabacteria bacterium]
NITIPVVSTITFYTGAGPMDMEQTVTAPIERAVTSVNDVSYVQSVTREGNSQIRVFFNWGANVDVGVIDITQHVNRILTNLPSGISPPIAVRFDLNSIPICNIAVSGDMDQRDMYDLAYNVIEPQVEHISGIAYAQVIGGRIREIHVTLDRNRIEAMQIPIQQVLTAVSQSNLILPSGDLKTGRFDFSLKTESQFNLVEPMKDIIVKTVNNVPIRLKDIGTVEDSYIEQSEVVRVNQKPGITLRVQKLSDFNTVEAVDNVLQALPHLYGVPSNIHLALSFDQSQYIRQSISGLQREAIIGALLAIIVIVIFLRNIRGTIIIFVAIPLSILITFIVFRFGGITLNIMTFGGLALGVGRLVDDSIVELEAITRHYGHRKQGENKMQATLAAAQEVAGPIFISTLTTVIVFLPVVFMTGIAKLMFIPLTITIAVALFGSFFVSRTVTPSLCYKFLPPEPALDRKSKRFSDRMRVWAHDMLERLDDWYEAKLRWALSHRKTVILGIIGASIISLGLFKFIGSEFFPDQDEGQMNLTVKAPVGTREEVTEEAVKKIEQLIKDNVPEVNTIISDIGVPSEKSGNLFSQNTGEHAATIQVSLVPAEKRKRSEFEIVNELRPKLSAIPGVKVFANPGGLLHFLLNFGSAAPIDVEIHGYDLETGTKLSKEIVNLVKSVSGTTDVQSSREDALPELRVTIDRDKAGVLGLNVQEISTVISTCINGTVASIFTDPKTGNEYNILVRLNESYRSQIDDLKKLAITTPSGGQVELGNVANIEMASSPVEIDR